ncbi:MAG: hypothetical protein KF833_14650 [Verrucomicrobiae bacterium]|nr:hypothetical protein [Verrucomicrobiae bacterium]
MNDWNIQSRARACQTCGNAFADQEPYHTLLFERRSGFERLDVCVTCWADQHQHGAADRKGYISHWQGLFTVPPAAPPEPIQRDNAETLLRRLTERNQPAWQPAAFILAVMLERKRVLKIRETLRAEGRRVFVYERPGTGEMFTVPDPQLRLDQLEQVQRDVAHLLEHGLPPEAGPAPESIHDEPAAEPVATGSPEAGPAGESVVAEVVAS